LGDKICGRINRHGLGIRSFLAIYAINTKKVKHSEIISGIGTISK
jgi:hypothetical protein